MYTASLARIRKTFSMAALMVIVSFVSIVACALPASHAHSVEKAKKTNHSITSQSAQVTSQPHSYFTSTTITSRGGASLDEYIINGPPVPPPGYELERAAVALPKSYQEAGVKIITDVPAFNWVFGCSSVSGAMIAGYYDRNGYPNIYTGPTNGGVMPLDNSSWPTWSDGDATYPNLPLAASHQGVDGRATRGSIDDYWVQYGSSASDPYITNGWMQHDWGEAIGDYMKTSQSAYGNTDGSTVFYTWNSLPNQLTCSDMVTKEIDIYDGTYGRKLFYEARGFTVTDCYNQKTDNNSGGFSFAQFKAEIDADRPVMLNLEGHTVVGVGYDDSTNTVYIHDTWDYSIHTMTWGGSYVGMQLLSVSIVNLSSAAPTTPTVTTTAVSSITTNSAVSGGNITYDGGESVTDRGVCWSTSLNPTTSDNCTYDGTGTGSFTSTITGLNPDTTYHVRAYATNSVGTGYGSDLTFSTLPTGCGGYTMNQPPYAFEDISTTGTNLNQGDDTYARFDIPFTFTFYGNNYTTVSVGSNGTVYFQDAYLGLGNTDIPGTNSYNVVEFIALLWDDLDPSWGGDVRWQVLGTAPNRHLIIQWTNVPHYNSSASTDAGTFQAILYEGTNNIRFNYQDVDFGDPTLNNGASATIGIQRDETCGMKFSYNTVSVTNNSSILFSTTTAGGSQNLAPIYLLLLR